MRIFLVRSVRNLICSSARWHGNRNLQRCVQHISLIDGVIKIWLRSQLRRRLRWRSHGGLQGVGWLRQGCQRCQPQKEEEEDAAEVLTLTAANALKRRHTKVLRLPLGTEIENPAPLSQLRALARLSALGDKCWMLKRAAVACGSIKDPLTVAPRPALAAAALFGCNMRSGLWRLWSTSYKINCMLHAATKGAWQRQLQRQLEL